MTMTINQLMDFSWMSQASYLGFTGLTPNVSANVLNAYLTNPNQINAQNIFSPAQATAFTDPN